MKQPKNFGFDDDARSLKDVARKFFQEQFTNDKLHKLVASDSELGRAPTCDWDQALWREVVELGWLMTSIPERIGGLGMPLVAVAGLVEEAGRAGFPSPLLSTLSTSYVLASCQSENADIALALILDGKTFSFAHCNQQGSWNNLDTDVVYKDNKLNGSAFFVQDAQKVDFFLVKACLGNEIGLFVVPSDADGVSVQADTIVDLTRDQATITFTNVALEQYGEVAKSSNALNALDKAMPAQLTLLAADMCGVAEWQLQTTAEYARIREQFDRPIGFFQAVKHPIVNVMVELDQARSLTYNAACAYEHETEMAAQYAHMAKSATNDMAELANRVSVQMHGGIGFTWECYVHIFMKRQMHSMLMLGDAVYQRQQLAELVLAA